MPLSNWAIRHRITVFVGILVIVLAGLSSYASLPRESSPDITMPLVLVTTPYFGVAPSDIETLVTNPMEEELEQLRDVREIRSTSAEGASIVSIEFEPGVDIDEALAKVRERVDAAETSLPSDAEDAIVTEIAISEFPVIVVNISGDVGLVALKRAAEEMQDEIERIPGTLEVNLIGGLEREIVVEADPHLLDYYRVTLLELVGTLQSANINLPGGAIDVGSFNYLVRVPGEFTSVTEIEEVIVRMEEGQPIRVRDVARVVDRYQDEATYSRIGGTQSVSLTVSRRAGENIIQITDEVKAIVDTYQANFGETLTFTTLADISDDIRRQLNELENNIMTGLVLVTLVLVFFMGELRDGLYALIGIGAGMTALFFGAQALGQTPNLVLLFCLSAVGTAVVVGGLRNALFVAAAIPLSMLISFTALSALGITLNIVVLFSLVLALGMLVDNAIVTVENIYRHGSMGKSMTRAAMDGVAEVAWPIITSTATTIFAFIPLLFWPGIMGEFMYFMPLTVVIVLAASLFVALVINPVLCASFMRVRRVESGTGNAEVEDTEAIPNNAVYRAYGGLLRFATRPVGAIAVLVASVGLFVGTLAYYGGANHGVEFFPETTPEQAFISVTLPDGSNVDASDRVVRQVERILEDEPNILTFVADVGAGNGGQMDFGAGGTAPHRSRITIDFVPASEREEPVFDTLERIRGELASVPGADFEIDKAQEGPPQGLPISLEIVGDDYAALGQLALEVGRIVRDVEGVVDLKDDYEAGRPEVRVEVDRDEASRVDVSVSTVANTVRAAINGIEASTYRENDEEFDIVVRLDEFDRDSIEDVERLTVSDSDGDQVPITEIANVRLGRGLGSIRHVDGERVVAVSADVADGFQDIEVLSRVREAVASQVELPPGYEVRYTGQNQDQEESSAFLGSALLSGLFLIALILITQFNSLLQPGIILASVLLSLIGVLWGLLVRELPFNIIMTGLGVISLAGIVVNNAIVLIDYINQLKQRGLTSAEAIINGGLVRFRPVMLTATTTALSLMPTVLGYNLDMKNATIASGGTSVELWGPMATAVVAGLAVATFLTLVVVPALFRLVDIVSASALRLMPSLREVTGEETS